MVETACPRQRNGGDWRHYRKKVSLGLSSARAPRAYNSRVPPSLASTMYFHAIKSVGEAMM